MPNEFAVDVLYSTGWLPLDTSGCSKDVTGRWYPSRDRCERECRDLGAQMNATEPQGFGCVTVGWETDADSGRCIAGDIDEAMIHALAQVRRSCMTTVAQA